MILAADRHQRADTDHDSPGAHEHVQAEASDDLVAELSEGDVQQNIKIACRLSFLGVAQPALYATRAAPHAAGGRWPS